jgi:hypothetical protein
MNESDGVFLQQTLCWQKYLRRFAFVNFLLPYLFNLKTVKSTPYEENIFTFFDGIDCHELC